MWIKTNLIPCLIGLKGKWWQQPVKQIQYGTLTSVMQEDQRQWWEQQERPQWVVMFELRLEGWAVVSKTTI